MAKSSLYVVLHVDKNDPSISVFDEISTCYPRMGNAARFLSAEGPAPPTL